MMIHGPNLRERREMGISETILPIPRRETMNPIVASDWLSSRREIGMRVPETAVATATPKLGR